jgi:hypothetical protein
VGLRPRLRRGRGHSTGGKVGLAVVAPPFGAGGACPREALVAARIGFLIEDVTDATEQARAALDRAARLATEHRAAT